MNDTTDYIEAYFNHTLEESERLRFEARCSSDEHFASEVAFYIAARSAAREALLQQKTEQWKPAADARETIAMKPAKKSTAMRWMPYAAAACLILVIAFYFLWQPSSAANLTAQYIDKNYSQLSQNMDGDDIKDSVQVGISEYNNRNYKRALALFEWVRTNDSANYDAKKYAGLTYLQIKDYGNALQRFKELSAMKRTYNAGDILQASVLLQRNEAGDEETAKRLLEKVVKEKEEGYQQAAEALKNE